MAEDDIFGEQTGDALFDRMSEIKMFRPDIDKKETDAGLPDETTGSLSQRMKLSPKMSDTQVVDKRLFPVLKEDVEWLNNLMVSRVFPETLNPLRNILIKSMLQQYPEMSFGEAVSIVEVAVTVPIDGEGRMDIIHLFSKLSETTEEEKKSKLI